MKTPQQDNPLTAWVIALLAVVLALLGYIFYREYRHIEQANSVAEARVHISDLKAHRPLRADDAKYIASWMTFDYVSFAYKVPIAAIQSALAASDASFPHVTIGRFARIAQQDPNAIVDRVKQAVSAYLSAASSTAPLPAK